MTDPTPHAAPEHASGPAPEPARETHRPRPVVDPARLRPAPSRTGRAETSDAGAFGRLLTTGAAPLTDDETAALAEIVDAVVEVLRALARAAGVDPEESERAIAHLLAFARRRVTGEYELDDFGFDADFTDHVYLPLLRPLYRHWFRVEVRGIENIPAEGPALVVANHSGTVALDALMLQVAVRDEHPARRRLRMLGADLLFATPYVGEVFRRAGATVASNDDAERLLREGHVVGVWPEGFKGVGKPFSERYRLQRFGRGGFVAAALRESVPIVPCSIVGAEETYPMLADVPALAKLLGLPYFPLTPFFPWFGVLGLVPLPTRWTIEIGEPIAADAMDPALADDPLEVMHLTEDVRQRIQASLHALLMERGSVFRS